MWELSINKQHQAEMELRHLQPIMRHLQHPNIEISRECAATVWGLAINEQSRALLLQLNVVEVLLSVARHSLNMQCMGDQDMLPGDYVAGGKCSQTQRNQLQVSEGSFAAAQGWMTWQLVVHAVDLHPAGQRSACNCSNGGTGQALTGG